MDWELWRIVGSLHFTATLQEISSHWTLDDVAEAHRYLDLMDQLEVLKTRKVK